MTELNPVESLLKEYEALLPGAGFRCNREIGTDAGTTIIEAVVA